MSRHLAAIAAALSLPLIPARAAAADEASSLVQRGALLLPIWGVEVVPGFTYGHTSQDGVTR
jgi:hypothetical protein